MKAYRFLMLLTVLTGIVLAAGIPAADELPAEITFLVY